VIQDTRRLLADPIWDRFTSACPGVGPKECSDKRALILLERAGRARGIERQMLIYEAVELRWTGR
jgi:hypothetical protein